jgi:hypothetical protein
LKLKGTGKFPSEYEIFGKKLEPTNQGDVTIKLLLHRRNKKKFQPVLRK